MLDVDILTQNPNRNIFQHTWMRNNIEWCVAITIQIERIPDVIITPGENLSKPAYFFQTEIFQKTRLIRRDHDFSERKREVILFTTNRSSSTRFSNAFW